MVTLRATKKVLRHLPKPSETAAPSDTALGDWYANRTVVDRTPLLILISARSLLPMVIRARDVRSLPERLPELVRSRLRRLDGVSARQADAEAAAMFPVAVGKTTDRSVLGVLVDSTRSVPFYVGPGSIDDAALRVLEQRLEEVPWYAGKRSEDVIFALDKTVELLKARWGGG